MKKIITMLGVLMLAMAFSLSAVAESVLAEEFHAAWDTFLAMEATMPEKAEPGKVSRATTLRIFNSNLQLTLPTGCSLHSSTSTAAYYVDSQTGLMFGISKMESYASIADWKAVLEYDGQDVSYGYINDVLSVIGLTYDSGYQVSCFANSGSTSYLIMCTGATYDQALYFIDILDTLCIASSTAPTATPTAAPASTPTAAPSAGQLELTQEYQILGSGTAVNLTADMILKSSSDTAAQWYSPAGNVNLFFNKSSTAHTSLFLSSMEIVWKDMGLTTGYYNYDGITTLACYGQVETGWVLYAYYNDNNCGYTISTTDRTKDEILLVAQILDTLHQYDPAANTPTPAPTTAPTAAPSDSITTTVLNTGYYITLPAGSAKLLDTADSVMWEVPVQTNDSVMMIFNLSLNASLSSLKTTYINKGWSAFDVSVNGISTVQVEKGSVSSGTKDVTVFFQAGSNVYSIQATGMNQERLTAFRTAVKTLSATAPVVTATPAPTTVPTAVPTAAPTATPVPGSYVTVPLRDSGLELYLDASAYLSNSDDSRDYWYDKTNRLSFFLYAEDSYTTLNAAARFFTDTMKYDLEWIVYNDIPGFRASKVNSYDADLHSVRYYFSADGQIYYVSAASLKTAALATFDKYIRTIHWADNNHGTLRLPAGLTQVEYLSFHNTDAYKVVVPHGCTSIETYAFASADKLTIAEIPATVTQISVTAFENCADELTIVAPAGSYAQTFAGNNGYHFCAAE